jgi:hypothetical protein
VPGVSQRVGERRSGISTSKLQLGLRQEQRRGEIGGGEVRSLEIGSHQVGPSEVGTAEVGIRQIRTLEVTPPEIYPSQVSAPQIGAVPIRITRLITLIVRRRPRNLRRITRSRPLARTSCFMSRSNRRTYPAQQILSGQAVSIDCTPGHLVGRGGCQSFGLGEETK